ncbi:hypothetical protein BG841_11505 [Marinobacter sp. X15-166B]|nr:hypothetical protein BG841_11505 [Marinobacter sp. X15-166B]
MQDLEIYVRDLETEDLIKWLAGHFEQVEVSSDTDRAIKGRAVYQGDPVQLSVYRGVMGKRYSSVVLEGATLPWETDLSCARSAYHGLAVEIRCSAGEWKEGDAVEDDKWWRVDARGEQLVVWN